MDHLILFFLGLLDENLVDLHLIRCADATAHVLVGLYFSFVDWYSRQFLAKYKMVFDVFVL